MKTSPPLHTGEQGLTLLGLLCTVALTALLLTQAVPSFQGLRARQALRAVAENSYADLQHARHLAIARNDTVWVSVHAFSAHDWCYGLSVGGGCDCAAPAGAAGACAVDGRRFVVGAADHPGVRLESPVPSGPARLSAFSPARGLSQAARLEYGVAGAGRVRVLISSLGRVRLCAPEPEGNRYYRPC